VGFAGPVFSTTGFLVDFFAALESLLRKTRVKKGIFLPRMSAPLDRKPLLWCLANQENVLRGGVGKSRPENADQGIDRPVSAIFAMHRAKMQGSNWRDRAGGEKGK
jgi:hypothetical protein